MKFSKITRHLNMKDVNRKQLQKEEALTETPTNSTSNVYPQTSEVPNQNVTDFVAASQGGYPLGLSAADGNHVGNATLGPVSGHTGVALAPPHPVTGIRRSATHITSGLGNSTPLRPGQTTTIGFSDNPPTRTMGSALWFYDPNGDSGQGRWSNLEWGVQQGAWGFWDTVKSGQFTGLYIFNTDLSQHPSGDVSSKIAGINFGANGQIGPAKNILITQRGIGDIEYHGPITPGRLFGLSDQGYNYLDSKSRRRLRGKTVYRTAGGGVSPRGIGTGNTYSFTTGPRLRSAQPVADPTTTTQTQQSPPEESEPPNIPAPESSPDKPFSTPNPTPPPDIPPLPDPKPQPGNYEGRPGRILDPTGLDQRAIELGYNDELYPVNPNRYYTTQVELGQSILSARMDAEYYGALSRGESPNYDNASINKAKANLAKAREMLDNWNRWKQNTGYMWRGPVKDTAYDQQKAAEKDLKDKKLQNEIDKLKADQAINDAAAEVYAAEARALLVKFGFDVALNIFGGLLAGKIMTLTALQLGKIPAVANFFKLSKAQQAARIAKAQSSVDDIAKTTGGVVDDVLTSLSDDVAETAFDIVDNLDSIIRNTNSSQAIKFKESILKAIDAGDEELLRRIAQQIKNSKFKNQVRFNFPKSTPKSTPKPNSNNLNNKTGSDGKFDVDDIANLLGGVAESNKVKGKLLNEASKLGHFEPDILDVDIEDIRKGIMPEFPEKPPAEMIDGYHQDSKLKPKELNKEPYLKIDEKDLIRNHRLKPNEAQEMMQTIDRINDYIKNHPEDLIHAQMRYPIDDPRLAELNWKMDQMLDAGEEYLEKNFKENKKLFNRVVDRTKKNIKLTDPRYVQQRYDELRGTNQKEKNDKELKNMKLKLKLKKYLPQYESKGVFKHVDSDDFKRNIK